MATFGTTCSTHKGHPILRRNSWKQAARQTMHLSREMGVLKWKIARRGGDPARSSDRYLSSLEWPLS